MAGEVHRFHRVNEDLSGSGRRKDFLHLFIGESAGVPQKLILFCNVQGKVFGIYRNCARVCPVHTLSLEYGEIKTYRDTELN